MKKIHILMTLLLCALLCSCGSKNFSDVMVLTNRETGKQLRLDMSQAEISQLLNKNIKYMDSGTFYSIEDTDMYVYIRDSKTTLFSISVDVGEDSPDVLWETSRGINVKSSFDEFRKAYPNHSESENRLTAYFTKEGDKYIEISESEKDNYKIPEVYLIELVQYTSNITKTTTSSLVIGNYSTILTG